MSTDPAFPGPNTIEFEAATARWNAYGAPNFVEAIVPASATDVGKILKAARASNVPFLATGWRHGYGQTLSHLQHGVAIDLSRLNSVVVDKCNATVTVGGGAKIRDVINPVADAGFQIDMLCCSSGACNGAGFVGTTLGVGVGYLQGTFGLVIDSLVSVELVTADGEQITVSESSNPDLFWVIRGAGANFGVVKSATYELSEQVNWGQVLDAELLFSAEQHLDYFKTMEACQDRMPSQLGFSSALFWNVTTNSTSILSTFIYVGTEQSAHIDLRLFYDLNPITIVAENIPFQRVPNVILNGVTETSCNTTNGLYSIHTVNVRTWRASTFSSVFTQFDAFLKKNEDARTANSAVIIDTFGTAAPIAVPDDSTAYPWRDSTGYIMLQMRWSGLYSSFGDTANDFAKKLRDQLIATSGYDGLAAYVNYAWGDETAEQIYRSDKLERLFALKKQWDPLNVFGFCNSIPSNT